MIAENVRANAKEIRDTIFSSGGRKILLIIGIILIGSLIFHAGVVVGSHRHFRGQQEQRFGFRPAPGMKTMQMPRGFIQNGHGTVGVVEQTAPSSFTIRMRDGSTQTVLTNGSTVIRSQTGNMGSGSIVTGEQVIVLGIPNDDGTITSDMIRIVPGNSQPQQ